MSYYYFVLTNFENANQMSVSDIAYFVALHSDSLNRSIEVNSIDAVGPSTPNVR